MEKNVSLRNMLMKYLLALIAPDAQNELTIDAFVKRPSSATSHHRLQEYCI
ncbi:hypothetical protein [Massilia sp. DWR3-1-1]|uniref:hypothetical protein n=1 Tax=Massilia sp. DWR3-1-1 TaxID=2804559 RepID=UPI003CF968C5